MNILKLTLAAATFSVGLAASASAMPVGNIAPVNGASAPVEQVPSSAIAGAIATKSVVMAGAAATAVAIAAAGTNQRLSWTGWTAPTWGRSFC
jgi:hypothetical protein